MAKKKTKKKNKAFHKFSIAIWIISILFMIVLGYFIYSANVLPLKYFLIIVVVFVILLSLHGIFILKKNTRTWVLVILNIFAIAFMCLEGFAVTKINETISFLKANLGATYETNIYNIIVNKDASYQSINDIKDHTVSFYKDQEDMSPLENALKEKVSVKETIEEMTKILSEYGTVNTYKRLGQQ